MAKEPDEYDKRYLDIYGCLPGEWKGGGPAPTLSIMNSKPFPSPKEFLAYQEVIRDVWGDDIRRVIAYLEDAGTYDPPRAERLILNLREMMGEES